MLNRKFTAGLIGLSLLTIQVFAQQDRIRGGWLRSRTEPPEQPKSTPGSKPTPRSKSTPRPAPAPRSKSTPQPRPAPQLAPEPSGEVSEPCSRTSPPATASSRQAALGLGYTLFMVNEAGDLVRVSPDRQFKSGDRICLLVEVNRTGYIYIFSQENNEAPKLLFPNSAIANGRNCVQAHQTFWLPEKGEIEFDHRPAREKLTVVFSEKPLANLAPSAKPEGEAVEASLFEEVARATAVSKGGQLSAGLPVTETEGKRGVKLNVKDPAPAHILLNQDAAQTRIVASIQLTHR